MIANEKERLRRDLVPHQFLRWRATIERRSLVHDHPGGFAHAFEQARSPIRRGRAGGLLFFELDALQPGKIRQRHAVEHLCARIAHLLHQLADAASFFIHAIFAALVRCFAYARHRRKRPIECAHQRAQTHQSRIARQEISAAGTLLAVQQAGASQLEENDLGKFWWDAFALGKRRGAQGLFALAGEGD